MAAHSSHSFALCCTRDGNRFEITGLGLRRIARRQQHVAAQTNRFGQSGSIFCRLRQAPCFGDMLE
jgi:hypothetical protein